MKCNKSLLKELSTLGKVRLSDSFYMRDMLYSEIASVHGMVNMPVDSEMAIEAGKGLCENVLEPLQSELGPISIRSAYRSPEVNSFGNQEGLNCANNENNAARHIWDMKDSEGYIGSVACVVVNSFIDWYEKTKDWTALAWWIHDNIPEYSSQYYFPTNAACNLGWSSKGDAKKSIKSYVVNPHTGNTKALISKGQTVILDGRSRYYLPWLESIGFSSTRNT